MKGNRYIVTDRLFKEFYGDIMYCIGISNIGFLQLAYKEDAPIADVYLGEGQCKLIKL